jgi:segregation and condensation protein A
VSAVPPAVADAPSGASSDAAAATASAGFEVRLEEFEGPFDLLLSLIAKHRLDVTVLALHRVVDDFVAHLKTRDGGWDLDETTEFLVVAATLLDLKAARLLPSGEVEDEEDLALLEARDLLFARLLQYRAFREVADVLAARMAIAARRHPRTVGLDPRFARLLPEVLLGLGPEEFAVLAGRAVAPRPAPPGVSTDHAHVQRVSIREQAAVLVVRLRRHGVSSFRRLASDADSTLVVVGRFLALLELYRGGLVLFDQGDPLGELRVRWVGPTEGDVELADDAEGLPDSPQGASAADDERADPGRDGEQEEAR